jgi:hypothetical protein
LKKLNFSAGKISRLKVKRYFVHFELLLQTGVFVQLVSSKRFKFF